MTLAGVTPGPTAVESSKIAKDMADYEEQKDALLDLLKENGEYEDFVGRLWLKRTICSATILRIKIKRGDLQG